MLNVKNIVILVLLVLVVILGIKNFKDPEEHILFDDSLQRNTILQQQKAIDSLSKYIANYNFHVDTIIFIETKIKHHYDTIYKFNNSASARQLDSVIRAEW